MKITYEEPLYTENIGLLATTAIIILGGLLFINFYPSLSSAVEITFINLAFIPALLLTVVFIGIGYFNYSSTKKNLGQIISEYDNLSNPFLDNDKFKGFYVNNNQMDVYNYKKLDTMPKNIAPYFIEEKKQNDTFHT